MRVTLFFLTAWIAAAGLWAQELGRIAGMEDRAIAVIGFSLERPEEVELEATVLRGAQDHEGSRVWILDAGSREVVWEPDAVETVNRSRFVHRWRQSVQLPAADYELYYAVWTGMRQEPSEARGLFESVVREMAGVGVSPKILADLGVVAHGRGRAVDSAEIERRRSALDLLVDLRGVGDKVLAEAGFALGAAATVEVYAQGELGERWVSDWGWLLDASSRQPIWEMSWEESEPGGGWARNRRKRIRIDLPAGLYAAGFQSDRGHSAARWFREPPFDPSGWGLQVRCVSGPGCATAERLSLDKLPAALEIARLTGLGDGERRELPFQLRGTGQLRVYAVGEEGHRALADHGWIERAGTGERVWQMQSGATRPAGGSAKNFRIDEVVELPPGEYVAVFETDDSHSVGGGWNAPPPLEADRWGMTLLVPHAGLSPD